jgi:hypothetical protein
MSNINDFISVVKRSSGLAKANKYEVDIYAPDGHPDGTEGRNLNLLCNSITMPGHNLEQQTQRLASEPAREMVQSRSFAGNITATFYLDQHLTLKTWFDKWLEMSINPRTNKAQYYNQYIGHMNIYQLGGRGRVYGVKCEEVYPATIGPIEYSYDSTDTIALLTIEFAYRRWKEVENLESGAAFKTVTELSDIVERLPGNGVLKQSNVEGFAERRRLRELFK